MNLLQLLSDRTFHASLSRFILFISAPTFISLQYYIVAPFGKQSTKTKKWGPTFNPRLAWFLFESPNLIWSGCLYFSRDEALFQCWSNRILLGLFVIHYVNRCIVYPLRIAKTSQKVNLSIMVSAFVFCSINGYLQAQSFYQFKSYPEKYHLTAPFLIGITLWTIGFCVNLSSDNILRNLRQTPGYKIPHGGLFRYVSCANFTGEIFEWFGFAIASQSLAGWAFLAFVCANLIPRACSHHSWYIEKFEDYPKGRQAVFPFIW